MEKRKPILVKLPPALVDEIDAYCDQQPARPTRTAVIEAAIEAFIAKNKRMRGGKK